MKNQFKPSIIALSFFLIIISLNAQTKDSDTIFNGFKFRSLGPALTSGRIADIAIHPEDESIWYVAVGSGGVWKTENSGTTWTPIFDKQSSYSIGCVTVDSNNPNIVWVGTGENVGGRHVGFGDGIYKSEDDGKTWKNLGLQNSEHISKIIIHPEDSNIIWVAVQGPLWKQGGERGLYKSDDGGLTWRKTLGDEVWTGVTDIAMDFNNPDNLYAATWDRHRTVAAYMGGGPGSGIHKSTDGGETWKKLTEGIPTSNLGKIGLAISPFDSDIIYAAIELDRKKGGVFMSTNKGESWTKQSDAVSGGTGPHYYQELYASPHQEGTLYLMSNFAQISLDHGKTFKQMNENEKHVDNHALVFKKSDPNYLMFGTDGGLYETFDLTKNWRFISNLPVTQFYKVAVDDSAPFYNIYGGTQDNGSQGGPSRTISETGITNRDWWITLGADGHQSAIEPGNPDITYGEYQEGWLFRIDQTTGETVFIQPQPREGEPYERFNWDAPILVSPHKPSRLYVASQRVWKSENRGDDWQSISDDLTKNQNRIELPILGKQQSWDNAWDVNAMSNYNTITSLAESPIQEGLLYAGTDDAIIQVSENGGESWRKIEVGSISGIPSTAFVNDIRADLFDASTVYAALDNHKYGDFKPYLIKSLDKGKTWTSIRGDLPQKLLTWRLVQDHVKKDLLFAATEYGVYVTFNGGRNWKQLKGNIPTISIRDITIQRREDDLVAASFGRGFYVLDDISALRAYGSINYKEDPILFKVKPAYWYFQKDDIYGQGDNQYVAKNPPFGANFTYYLPEKVKSLKSERKEAEKLNKKNNTAVKFPGWNALEKETHQEDPIIILTVKDSDGMVVNTIEGTNIKGFNRVNWDLSYPEHQDGVKLIKPAKVDSPWSNYSILATPGDYTVTLSQRVDGKTTQLGTTQQFKVIPLKQGALKGSSYDEIKSFTKAYHVFQDELVSTKTTLSNKLKLVDAMKRAADKSMTESDEMFEKIHSTRMKLLALDKALTGDKVKSEIGEKYNSTPESGNTVGLYAVQNSYGPTANHKKAFTRAQNQLKDIKSKLNTIIENDISQIENELEKSGAPWIEGQGLIKN